MKNRFEKIYPNEIPIWIDFNFAIVITNLKEKWNCTESAAIEKLLIQSPHFKELYDKIKK